MSKNKYNARKTTIDGVIFDSSREAKRWQELKLLEKSGQIKDLKRQVYFVIADSVRLSGEARRKPALRYVVDFVYMEADSRKYIHEDAKGFETPESRMKRHLMMYRHGIDVRCV